MTVKVLTHFTPNWKELSLITVPVLQKYCDKHGYHLSVFENTPYQNYTGKEKMKQILEVCKYGDIAMVIDADAIITNPEIKIESFIDDDHDFYITKHVGCVNAGVFILRFTQWTEMFINKLLPSIGKERIHCEQDSITQYMADYPNSTKIKVCSHPSFNSFDYSLYPEHKDKIGSDEDWRPNHFVLHLPGTGMELRTSKLSKIKTDYNL